MKKIFVIGLLFFVMIIGVYAETSDSKIITVSLVNQDPDPAIAGDIVEIRIGVENTGGEPAENMILEIILAYPFTQVPGEDLVQEVGTIKSYQYDDNMKIVKFKLRIDRDVTAGSYEIKLKEYEEGKESVSTVRSLNIDIESKESAEVIYIDKVELIPGKITPLKFTINNVGSAPLRELSFQWENEDDIILPVGSDNTKYIRYIEVGDSTELDFDVIASAIADPNLYKLDLTLTYDDPITGEETEINTKAGVYVGGATDFDAAFSGSSSGEYSFAISNIGSVSASSVTVKVPDQQGWRASGSNSVIIGNLNEGDYTIASFTLQKSANSMGTRNADQKTSTDTAQQRTVEDSPIKLEIIYTDSRGNRNTIEKEVLIDSSSVMGSMSTEDKEARRAARQAAQNPLNQLWTNGKWILVGLIILGLFIVVRKKYKKQKLENSDYTHFKAIKDIIKGSKNLIKFKKNKK